MTFIERHWHSLHGCQRLKYGGLWEWHCERVSLAAWLKVSELGIQFAFGFSSQTFVAMWKNSLHGALQAWIALISCCWQGLLTGNRWLLWFGGSLGWLGKSGYICQWATKARHLLIKLAKIASPWACLIKPFPHLRWHIARICISQRPSATCSWQTETQLNSLLWASFCKIIIYQYGCQSV